MNSSEKKTHSLIVFLDIDACDNVYVKSWLTIPTVTKKQKRTEFSELDQVVQHLILRDKIAIIPGRIAYSTVIEKPNAPKKHLRDAIAYHIEEELCEPIENMHVAWNPLSENRISVTAITREKIEKLIAFCQRAAGLKPTAMVTERSLLPSNSEIRLYLYNGYGHILGDSTCVSAPASGISHYVHQLIKLKKLPANFSITVYTSDKSAHLPEKNTVLSLLTKNHHDATISTYTESQLEEELAGIAIKKKGLYLNLLQGDFAPESPLTRLKKIAIPTVLLGVVGAAYIVNAVFMTTELENKLAEVRDEQNQVYRHLFPEDTKIIDPVKQLKIKLKSVEKSTKEKENVPFIFSDILISMGHSPARSEVTIESINYDASNRAITIIIKTSQSAYVTSIRNQLVDSNYSANITKTSNEDGLVRGMIQIELQERK